MGEYFYEKNIIRDPPGQINDQDIYGGSFSNQGPEEVSVLQMQFMLGSILFCMIGIQCGSFVSIARQKCKDYKTNISLKDYLITDDMFEDCSICLDTLKRNDTVIQLECDHLFHKACIKQWFDTKVNNNCPLCRNII